MKCDLLKWRWPRRHRRLQAAYIRRLNLSLLYFQRIDERFKEFTMSLAQLKWTLPVEDVNDASAVDVFDNGTAIGSVGPDVAEFSTGDLASGDHSFTVVVRSRAGAAFDSDASNAAVVTVPVASVKLTAVSDLSAALA